MTNTTRPPKWCRQLTQWPQDCSGAKGSDFFDGNDVALEALGEQVKEENSSLLAMAYLYRRFGPPAMGTDEYKKLCSYVIGTPVRGVYLLFDVSGSPLEYSIGYVAKKTILEKHYAPQQEAYMAWRMKVIAWYEQQSELIQTQEAFEQAFYNTEIMDKVCEAVGRPNHRKSREQLRNEEGVVKQMNDAIVACLREFLRPVYIRDVSINLFGYLSDKQNNYKHCADYYSTEKQEKEAK